MRITVTSVLVDDQEKALRFYTDILGFKKKTDIPMGGPRWLTVVSPQDIDGTELLLEPDEHPAARPFKEALVADGIPFTSFGVDDVAAEASRLKGLGVRFTQELEVRPQGEHTLGRRIDMDTERVVSHARSIPTPSAHQGPHLPNRADEFPIGRPSTHHRPQCEGAMTMRLTASMMLTVDGVYQGPGGTDEDRRDGFDRGGWTAPFADQEGWRILTAWFERADAFLLGRKTWEIWEPYWPHHDGGDPVSHGINVLPKYVPSTTLKDPTWQNTHVIDGDVEAAVRELKAKPGRELQVHGSGELLRWLLERDLVDELNLRIYPVVLGAGLRLFPEQGQTHSLELIESTTVPSGVTLLTYRPAGRATFGTAG